MAKRLKVTQVRSAIGRIEEQKRTIKALGIRKRGRSAVHDDTPAVRGMIRAVRHLVTVEEAGENDA
jgi:large subunit ribosomal protein L30